MAFLSNRMTRTKFVFHSQVELRWIKLTSFPGVTEVGWSWCISVSHPYEHCAPVLSFLVPAEQEREVSFWLLNWADLYEIIHRNPAIFNSILLTTDTHKYPWKSIQSLLSLQGCFSNGVRGDLPSFRCHVWSSHLGPWSTGLWWAHCSTASHFTEGMKQTVTGVSGLWIAK